jgi:hypothetical protein
MWTNGTYVSVISREQVPHCDGIEKASDAVLKCTAVFVMVFDVTDQTGFVQKIEIYKCEFIEIKSFVKV